MRTTAGQFVSGSWRGNVFYQVGIPLLPFSPRILVASAASNGSRGPFSMLLNASKLCRRRRLFENELSWSNGFDQCVPAETGCGSNSLHWDEEILHGFLYNASEFAISEEELCFSFFKRLRGEYANEVERYLTNNPKPTLKACMEKVEELLPRVPLPPPRTRARTGPGTPTRPNPEIAAKRRPFVGTAKSPTIQLPNVARN